MYPFCECTLLWSIQLLEKLILTVGEEESSEKRFDHLLGYGIVRN
jgi:hypothetical protein